MRERRLIYQEAPPGTPEEIRLAQGPPPKPKRRLKLRAKSERGRMALRTMGKFTDRLTGIEDREKQIRLLNAITAINSALQSLKVGNQAVAAALETNGVKLQNTDYYLPIAIKESGLDPKKVSGSNAKGYFQILFKDGKSQVLDAVKKYFTLNYSESDIFYDGDDPKKLAKAAKKNAIVGILYWHICRDIAWKKHGLTIPDADRDKAAAISYNLGPTAFADLWKTLKAKDFKDFATKLAKRVQKQFPKNISITKDGAQAFHDSTYDMGYLVYLFETEQLPADTSIKIGKYDYKVQKLLRTLRYTELVYGMMHAAPTATEQLPKPKGSDEEEPGIPADAEFEIIKEGQWLWSIADKLLTKCTDTYKIPYCMDESVTKTDKINFLIEVIIKYNNEINNPDFEDLDQGDAKESLGRGTKIYFPPKKYIEKAVKQANIEVKPPPEPKTPEVLKRKGFYCGREAEKWDKTGKEKFTRSPKPTIVTPQGLDPAKKSPHGKMPATSVTSVIIHTTEGSANGLYRGQGMHYLVKPDGTIELIRNDDIAIDHAGRMKNSRSKAIWNGDKSPSLHSVGIEVETEALRTLVENGKVFVEAQKSDVKSKKIRGKTVYYTDKPPTQQALDAGFKQARMERNIKEKQYKALKKLLYWLGGKFKLRKRNILTHSMVAVSKYGRGRKPDPPIVDWEKLGLPDNHHRIDPEVLAGTVNANLKPIKDSQSGKTLEMINIGGKDYYRIIKVEIGGGEKYSYLPGPHFGEEDAIAAGVEGAETLRTNPTP